MVASDYHDSAVAEVLDECTHHECTDGVRLPDVVTNRSTNTSPPRCQRQISDPAHPNYGGGFIRPDWGIADPSHTSTTPFVTACALLYLAKAEGRITLSRLTPSDLLGGATLAIDYILRVQRPSGLIDLQDCNYDSSPDTGFAVQSLCGALELGRALATRDAAYAALLAKVERFVRLAVPGMLTGGFHTPNHRWVLASASRRPMHFFPT